MREPVQGPRAHQQVEKDHEHVRRGFADREPEPTHGRLQYTGRLRFHKHRDKNEKRQNRGRLFREQRQSEKNKGIDCCRNLCRPPPSEERQQTAQQEARHERVRYTGDPGHALDMSRVHSEKKRGSKGDHPVAGNSFDDLKHEKSSQQVAQHGGRVPTGGFRAEQHIVQAEPQQQQRAVVVSTRARMQRGQHVRRKVLRQITPSVQRGALEDLENVVVNESESECAEIDQRSHNAGENFHGSWAEEPRRREGHGCMTVVHVSPAGAGVSWQTEALARGIAARYSEPSDSAPLR